MIEYNGGRFGISRRGLKGRIEELAPRHVDLRGISRRGLKATRPLSARTEKVEGISRRGLKVYWCKNGINRCAFTRISRRGLKGAFPRAPRRAGIVCGNLKKRIESFSNNDVVLATTGDGISRRGLKVSKNVRAPSSALRALESQEED